MSGHLLDPEDRARLSFLESKEQCVIGSGHWSMVTDEGGGRVVKHIKNRKFLENDGAGMWRKEVRNFEILARAFPEGLKGLPRFYGAGRYEEGEALKAGFYGWIAMEKMPGKGGAPENPAAWHAYWERLFDFLDGLSARLSKSPAMQAHFPAPRNYILVHLGWAQKLFQRTDPVQAVLSKLERHLRETCRHAPSEIMHADPNGGNVLADADGSLSLVDLSALARDMPEWCYQYCIGAPGMEAVPAFIENRIRARGHSLKKACLVGAVHQFWHVAFDYRNTDAHVDWDRYGHERSAINVCLRHAGIILCV